MNLYLLPMTGAIWSTPMGEMLDFPIQAMITFMSNHKLLQINDRWQWKTGMVPLG
jgi:predicted NAD/FAD-binding protein